METAPLKDFTLEEVENQIAVSTANVNEALEKLEHYNKQLEQHKGVLAFCQLLKKNYALPSKKENPAA